MRKPFSFSGMFALGVASLTTALVVCQVQTSAQQGDAAAKSANPAPAASGQRQLLDKYCVTCHNDKAKTGGLSLSGADVSKPEASADLWEKVVRKMHTGMMPPPNMPQP
jgi:hypothetical protein